MPAKKFLEQRCDIFRLILHSLRLRFLSQWPSVCVLRSEKSFSAELSNETSFKMDSILIWARLLANSKAHSTHCSRSTTCREIELCDTLTLVLQTRTRLQRHLGLACLEIRWKNEEAINSTRNMIINNNELYQGIRSAINPSIWNFFSQMIKNFAK